MTSLTTARRPSRRPRQFGEPSAAYVVITESELTVTLKDGRTLSVPLGWYPRLVHGTPAERNHWELVGRGTGIHWPDLDEDISVEGLIAGRRSMESPKSFKRSWASGRGASVPRSKDGRGSFASRE